MRPGDVVDAGRLERQRKRPERGVDRRVGLPVPVHLVQFVVAGDRDDPAGGCVRDRTLRSEVFVVRVGIRDEARIAEEVDLAVVGHAATLTLLPTSVNVGSQL